MSEQIILSEKKVKFQELALSTTVNGVEKVLEWLETTDFYTAPASTKYHGAFEGGLLLHSLAVADMILKLPHEGMSEKAMLFCALFHDICKVNFYTVSMRNVKQKTGTWREEPYYSVEDQFPLGHGEKSALILSKFVKMPDDVMAAIRWHMGGFDEAARGGSYAISQAYDKYPLAALVHMADMGATYLAKI